MGKSATVRVLYRSRLRPVIMCNEYQKGTLLVCKQTLEAVTREVLKEKYRQTIVLRAALPLRLGFAEELLRSGELNRKGMSWTDVVIDAAAFVAEVQQRVEKKLADQVIILRVNMKVF
ncbi:hypothetical protein TraAM80_00356 [Trypanosoma rangeli]|uniref:Uncharacterized protein n=1 Tax=Trypanosoma rangeli TaxID=5698 RepID=A0A3R7NV93_TRYRA|nr:uncharacterized protein TraAM80_00356 [Trypanosoma rangeli]RNF12345.1 hypothetical protein TraAM80_00356 [Trypanosoma rangeli]|eukprot:RNF12345.1 hypothetical protein TraAM80_00356 [Trypanosoma rangeli]